ncbi:MAG: ectoine hydroxylase-related dioxygenase (phytanoyl-CoA dioxygenase family) [Candidatus Latescibacterota bacterium]|jgi:ectoine hydroxylase-related dioxygenase (phytanoyl-CoA dioxygenase family)
MSHTLTPAQRFHFDTYGYVLLENVLSDDEVADMKDALYRLKADPNRDQTRVYANQKDDYHILMGNLVAYDPALLAYAAHPKLVPLVEEVVGGSVRLEETEAIINQRSPDITDEELATRRIHPTGFHRGTSPTWGCYIEEHKFHCIFVKTLAYLTDVGPNDGGTSVIPGSHRSTWKKEAIIQAALDDPTENLIHQIEAKAGSVLLFAESLIHSTTHIKSDIERVILVAGYTPPMVREWMNNEVDPKFIETLPEAIRPLISGSDNWKWKRNYD